MTDITELAQSLKAAAKKATPGPWALARDRKTVVSSQSHPIANLSDAMHRMLADGTTGQDAEFISLANPANILALVEALALEKRICATWRKTAEANSEKLEKAQAKADVYDMLRDDYCLREKGVGLADFVDWQAKRISDLESCTVKLPLPACTYADHSYPAYTKQQVLSLLESLGVIVIEEDM